MGVVELSTAKYRNREALDKALHVYLEAMYSFVSRCLDSELIRNALRLPSDSNIREKIEVKDIAHLIRTWPHWDNYFKEEFKIIDRDDIRYYDARSVTGLIVEGRNQVSHQRLRELDRDFTRCQLFLIAEILGKINNPDAQREIEDIRDELFDDTAEQLEAVSKTVEVEQAKYEKSIAEVEKQLVTGKKRNNKLSKQIIDNAVKLDEKAEELEKLSGQLEKLSEQLVSVKLSEKEYKKQFNSTSKKLEKVQAVHSTCEEHLTTISNQLATVEAERDDYKKCLETVSKELEEAETEWQACEGSLAAMRNLFTVSTLGNMIFPPFETDSTVRILDRRGVGKKNYLLELLEQKQPTLIYVQSEEMVDLLLERVMPEKADLIEKHGEQTSETEEMEILKRLENAELIAVVSDTTFSTTAQSHCVEHFVLCHLVPGLDAFFDRCQPAFTSEKDTYLHLIYNSEQDIKGLVEKYPNRGVLEKLYPELRKRAETNGNFIKTENLYSELGITKLGIETSLAIFEDLQLIEQNGDGIKFLPPVGKKLDESEIYLRGENLKKEMADFQTFQLEHSIEQIWGEILEKLNVDSEQILRESNIYSEHFKVSERDNNAQPITETEQDKITPPISDVWPLRTLSAFNSLRHRAAKEGDIWIEDGRNTVRSPFASYHFESTEPTLLDDEKNEKDYQRKYGLAMQFAQEHGVNALEQGIVQLIKDQDDPDYNFTEDETYMLRAFQNALADVRTQSEQSSGAVEGENTADSETAETSPPSKTPKTRKSSEPKLSTADKFRQAKSLEERVEIGRQVAELRINATGLKGLSWKKIREKLGLKNDEFHEVVRLENHFHESCVERIESFEDGWEYGGKLEFLLGFDPVGELADRIEACKPKTGSKG